MQAAELVSLFLLAQYSLLLAQAPGKGWFVRGPPAPAWGSLRIWLSQVSVHFATAFSSPNIFDITDFQHL